jgi:iron complex transport system ATP-binding protein
MNAERGPAAASTPPFSRRAANTPLERSEAALSSNSGEFGSRVAANSPLSSSEGELSSISRAPDAAGVVLDGVSLSIEGASILQEVSATLPPGTVTGLLGPNGAGKSSLLRIIAGIDRADAGMVTLDGAVVGQLRRREAARRIALLEQNVAPSVDLSVREVVLLGRIPHRSRLLGSFGGEDDLAVATEALAMVGAADLIDRRWHTLSGGQQQRVQIARALAQRPSLLLLDEPTNHLDVSAQLSLLHQVRGLGLTSVLALHDLNLAAAYCDRIVLLQDGRLAAFGTPAEVLRPEIIRSVYGVDCDIVPHPRTGRPVIVFSGPDDQPVPPTSAPPAARDATSGLLTAPHGAPTGNSPASAARDASSSPLGATRTAANGNSPQHSTTEGSP